MSAPTPLLVICSVKFQMMPMVVFFLRLVIGFSYRCDEQKTMLFLLIRSHETIKQ